MRYYEITYANPQDDWKWMYMPAKDYHEAVLYALLRCEDGWRVHRIEYRTQDEMDAIYRHRGENAKVVNCEQ